MSDKTLPKRLMERFSGIQSINISWSIDVPQPIVSVAYNSLATTDEAEAVAAEFVNLGFKYVG